MTTKQVMQELKKAGSEQTRKIYGRHGVETDMFGVSYAQLGKMTKRVGTDHALAEELWATGNHDARVLATMIADPAELRSTQADAWARELGNYPLTDAFSSLVAKTPFAAGKMAKWTKSKNEWIATAGWNLLGSLAMSDEPIADAELEERLAEIEAKIHSSKNRARYAMNNALIAIGTRNPRLEEEAVAAARRIGTVHVDHGATSCKTPDAVQYIPKAAAHRRRKAKKR